MAHYSCKNCNVKFESVEIQREHYKTDWHHYNLKRRVASLHPISAEEFKDRVLQVREAEVTALQEQHTSLYCNACRKQFRNLNAHDNHLNSKKHKENLIKFEKERTGELTTRKIRVKSHSSNDNELTDDGKGSTKIDEEMNDWEIIQGNQLTEKDCLFCNHESYDMSENIMHMSSVHSFFIPDIENCFNLEGLIFYLGEKITRHFTCVWCDGRAFQSVDAVRKHMKDKGHCQIPHEGPAFAEYKNYFDYSCNYPDHINGMEIDADEVTDPTDEVAYEIVLPSGIIIGHRSLLRYYKQRLNTNSALVPKKFRPKSLSSLTHYRNLGCANAARKRMIRNNRHVRAVQYNKAKFQLKISNKINKLLKKF